MGKTLDKNINIFLEDNSNKKFESVPVIFDLSKSDDQKKLSTLIKKGLVIHVVDDYKEQLRELFQVKNPTLVFDPKLEEHFAKYLKEIAESIEISLHGRWVFYPWISTLVHVLEDEDFQSVRTARNKNLINAEEQEKFFNSTIGIAGLSVGSNVALGIALQGGGRHLKLADFDVLALSNTNRIRTGVDSLGLPKVEMAARQIYLTNPYVEIELFSQGLTEDNIESFFKGLDVIVDEIDNLALKYLIREHASKNKVPLVMGADNGDNAVIDIERYDLDPDLEFFHGRIGKTSYQELSNLDKMGIGRKIVQHIGVENITRRVQESMMEIGKTIVSWPQLGGAALLNGAAVAYCVRKILTGDELEGNRSLISLDEKLIPDYFDNNKVKEREENASNFKKGFDL